VTSTMGIPLEATVVAAVVALPFGFLWSLAAAGAMFAGVWLLSTRKPTSIDAERKFLQAADGGARLKGPLLRIVAFLMESSVLLRTVSKHTVSMGKLQHFLIEEVPTFLPRHFPSQEEPSSAVSVEEIVEGVLASQKAVESSVQGFRFNTIADYHHAYLSGKCTPTDVANRLIAAVEHSNKCHNLRAIVDILPADVLAQAEASSARYAAGTPLGPLDGVPVSAKDQIDVANYTTSKGMRVGSKTFIASEDATSVAKLRAAGAVIFGKANQTEIGIHVTGMNANGRYGHCRNPYNTAHHTGGSSSGSGSAVAAGLGPVSVAADGGGSIRMPAGMCGIVGIKPTCGRVSLLGDTACYGSTVDVVGPIAATAFDSVIALVVMSGRDAGDPATLHSPPMAAPQFPAKGDFDADLHGVRIGVDRAWFARATEEMTAACQAALTELTNRGAIIVNVSIPDLDLLREAHSLTISAEMYTDVHEHATYNPSYFQPSTRLLLAAARDTTAHEYLQAAKLRTRLTNHFLKAFEKCDCIATPNNGLSPPEIPEDVGDGDESDLVKQLQVMSFMQAANFTGLPATCFPVAYTGRNVPIALQLIGKPWAEAELLRLAAVASTSIPRKRPMVYYDLLSDGPLVT